MIPRARRAGRRRLLSLIGSGLILTGLLPVGAAAPVAASNTVQVLPFTQNWSNTTLITANDDWSGVPGIGRSMAADVSATVGPHLGTIRAVFVA